MCKILKILISLYFNIKIPMWNNFSHWKYKRACNLFLRDDGSDYIVRYILMRSLHINARRVFLPSIVGPCCIRAIAIAEVNTTRKKWWTHMSKYVRTNITRIYFLFITIKYCIKVFSCETNISKCLDLTRKISI